MFGRKFADRLEYIVLPVVLFGIAVYSVCNAYGFLLYPDEYTYWAYAAFVSGYDWSDITSLGMYFSYGYSLILIPVFVFCKNAVTAYRMAVGINFIFLMLSFICLVKAVKAVQDSQRVPVTWFAAVAVCFPGYLFYAQMTMTETLLILLYLVIGMLLYLYLENGRLQTLFLLLAVMMYLYVVHMRTVGILLAGLVVLLFHMLSGQGKKSHILWTAGVVGILFAASAILKSWSFTNVFGGMNLELVSGNDYSGQLEKIKYIFTLAGFYDFVISLIGKFLYLGLSTYGLFYWGVYSLIRTLFDKTEKSARRQFNAYILLGMCTQVVIATVYLLNMGAVSDYTYGRYSEIALPYIIVAGLCEIWKRRTKVVWIANGAIAILHLPVTYLIVKHVLDIGVKDFAGYFMVGMSYLYQSDHFDIGKFYAEAWLFGTLLTAVVTALLLFCRSGKKREIFLAAVLIMEIALAVRADKNLLQPFRGAAYRDRYLAEKIEGLCEGREDARIIYKSGSYPPYIGILQFMMRDTDIEPKELITDVRENDILIYPFDDASREEWRDEFEYTEIYGHFAILYNQ